MENQFEDIKKTRKLTKSQKKYLNSLSRTIKKSERKILKTHSNNNSYFNCERCHLTQNSKECIGRECPNYNG